MPVVKLEIPHRSQWTVPDADLTAGDCGPTCVAMLLNGLNVQVTPDDLYTDIYPELKTNPDMEIPDRGYTNFGHLYTAANAHDLRLKRFTYAPAGALKNLKASIDEGKPSIALVNYSTWRTKTGNNFNGAHFVVVVGYDDTHVYVHDPLFGAAYRTDPDDGAYFEWTNEEFKTAWSGFALHENPNYACLTAQKKFPFMDDAAPVERDEDKAIDEREAVHTFTTQGRLPLLAELKRRIMALAAYEGATAPNLDDAVTLNYWAYHVGKWGERVEINEVKSGDSLWTIASEHYGQGAKWHAIMAFNELPNSMLAVGQRLEIPMPGQLDVSEVLDPTIPAHEEVEGSVPLPGHGGPEPNAVG